LYGDCGGTCKPNIYGLGERVDSLRLSTDNKTYTMWNHDNLNTPETNLYGSHPFYLEVRNGISHGVFLLNSNAMDVNINWSGSPSTSSLTYKTIGGVLDFYIFTGPTPELVIQQYQKMIGYPHLPSFWSFGFHQSRCVI
jgi:lysosomal alpha-glucosidase